MDFDLITPKELSQYLHQEKVILIDLRSPDEYVRKHIKGAVNIPYDNLKECCLFPRESILIFYCDRGTLSMVAAREYARKGYRTKSLVGGFVSFR